MSADFGPHMGLSDPYYDYAVKSRSIVAGIVAQIDLMVDEAPTAEFRDIADDLTAFLDAAGTLSKAIGEWANRHGEHPEFRQEEA